jgi:hypothetical protein
MNGASSGSPRPRSQDKRISYGCINLPVAFYEEQVKPIFANQRAVVYVLPEVKSLEQVFALAASGAGAARAADPPSRPAAAAAAADRPG